MTPGSSPARLSTMGDGEPPRAVTVHQFVAGDRIAGVAHLRADPELHAIARHSDFAEHDDYRVVSSA